MISKYLDNPFGINEITAYASISYKELSQSIEDKQMKNGLYKALEKQRTALKKQLKNRLGTWKRLKYVICAGYWFVFEAQRRARSRPM